MDAAKQYLARQTIRLDEAGRVDGSDGYAVVRVGEHALGMGRIVRREGALVSEFPKVWAR